MKSKKTKQIIIIAVVVLVALCAGVFIYVNSLDKAFDPAKKDTQMITVEMGSTSESIGNQLEDEGIIKSASKFKIYSKIKGLASKYKAGTYALSPSMTLGEIGDIIAGGKVSTLTFTIPEGYTTAQIAKTLDEAGIAASEEFMNEVRNGKFDFDFVPAPNGKDDRLEGYLYPDTYTVEFGSDAHRVVEVFLKNFDEKFTKDLRKKAEKKNMSMNQVLTMASLIERECQVDSERRKVASVIYNRLDKGMMLQIDATIQYLLGSQKEHLLYSDLEIDSPYNTYKNTGLPPGPICSPGVECIKAALDPADTDYIYYVLDPKLDGSHRFSNNAANFEKDKAAYAKAIND